MDASETGTITAAAPTNDNLSPSTLEKIEGLVERARERLPAVPTLTTALLIAVFFVGLGVGAMASKPFHRSAINAEWRERIASKSKLVREAVAEGNADSEQADNAAIDALGEYDARLSKAELAVKNSAVNVGASVGNGCGIPIDRVRQ